MSRAEYAKNAEERIVCRHKDGKEIYFHPCLSVCICVHQWFFLWQNRHSVISCAPSLVRCSQRQEM